MAIPEDKKSELITSGIGFLKAVTSAYGTEQGLELWETISNTIDPELKGQIFFAMLIGDYHDIITIQKWMGHNHLGSANGIITAIKTLRSVAPDPNMLGLKEAKDAVESLRDGYSTYKLSCSASNRQNVIKELRSVGFVV